MRKIVVSMFVSLDGFVDEPHKWSFPYWGDDIGKFKQDELFASESLLLGRVTYEGFAEAWPPRAGADEYTDRINSMPKHVASRTLQETTWNASLIQGDMATEIGRLKEQPGQDLLVFGSIDFTQTLMKRDAVDQYNLLVYPILLGKGTRLFQEGEETKLRLADSHQYDSGVMGMTYIRERDG